MKIQVVQLYYMNPMVYKINLNDKIYIAGHTGLVGSALLRIFKKKGYNNLIYEKKTKLNLLNQLDTFNFIKLHSPDVVIMAAGVTGVFSHHSMASLGSCCSFSLGYISLPNMVREQPSLSVSLFGNI